MEREGNDMDVSDLNKADVLAVLYNACVPMGMGFLQARNEVMTREDAEKLLKKTTYFDYLYGRPMKIKIEDDLHPSLYDRDQGWGAAARAIEVLRETGEVNHEKVQGIHETKLNHSAAETKGAARRSNNRVGYTDIPGLGTIPAVEFGMDPVAGDAADEFINNRKGDDV